MSEILLLMVLLTITEILLITAPESVKTKALFLGALDDCPVISDINQIYLVLANPPSGGNTPNDNIEFIWEDPKFQNIQYGNR